MHSKVNKHSILSAYKNISQYLIPSPLRKSDFYSKELGHNFFLKLENLNPTGSFKIRGACNAMLNQIQQAQTKGVVAASAGNHAQGVAKMANQVSAKCTIFMPIYTPQIKIFATKSHGAEVVLTGQNYDETYEAALKFTKDSGSIMIHGFSDIDVINGQGTVGLEILQQLANVDVVVIPIGGGGLIAGIATYIKESNPKIKVIGVQTTYYPAMRNMLTQKNEIQNQTSRTIADGIAVKSPGDLNYQIVQNYVDDIVVVNDDQISSSIFNLMEKDHIVAEGAGAAATAAIQYSASKLLHNLAPNSNIVSIVSGGNIDFNLLNKISSKVMNQTGRLLRIHITIEDRPGHLSKILKIISDENVNIVDINHNRIFNSSHAYHVECTFDLETLDFQHQEKLIATLQSENYTIRRDF